MIGEEMFNRLAIGTRVRIKESARIKPLYLKGATGEVVAKRTSKVTIKLDTDIDDPYGKWAGHRCILDPGWLEIVSSDEAAA
jgi:hypothetical protein